MRATFWTNTIWYILLGATSIVSLILSLAKSKNKRFTFAFTLATLGLEYQIEYVLVVVLNAYSYYPRLTGDSFQDTVLGNMFSQISIATTSTLAIEYKLKTKWYFIFAAIYFCIEELFLSLHIYEHHWYRSIYTLMGFIPLFIAIRIWHDKLLYSSQKFIEIIALYLGAFAISANTIILPLKLLKLQIFQIPLFDNYSKNHTATVLLYGFLFFFIIIFAYKKLRLAWQGAVFAGLFVLQYALNRLGILHVKDGLFLLITGADLLGFYFYIVTLGSFLARRNKLDYYHP